MNTFLLILLGGAMLAVVGTLFLGIVSMVRGGAFNARHGNRLMRWRVILQGLALGLFVLALLAAGK